MNRSPATQALSSFYHLDDTPLAGHACRGLACFGIDVGDDYGCTISGKEVGAA